MEMNAVQFSKLFNQQDLLTKEEEKKLIKEAAGGNTKAKQKLVLANLRYAATYANNVNFSNLSQDDLYLECVIGLIKAADHVKPDYDNKFITYATWWMKSETNEAMNKYGSDIRIPDKKFRDVKKVRAVYGNKMAKYDDDKKSRQATAKKLNMTEDQVNELLMISENVTSLEGLFENTESSNGYEEHVFNKSELSLEDSVVESAVRNDVRKIVKRLPKKEANVLIMHFGLNGNKPMSFSEIGEAYGLTKAWANDVEKKAIGHLLQYSDELEQLIA